MTIPEAKTAPETGRAPAAPARVWPAVLPAVALAAALALLLAVSAELAVCAAIGLATGQAFALLLDRAYRETPLPGPVYACPACRAPVTPALALPLAGWAFAAGRCPDCRRALPLRMIVLPAGAAALFTLASFLFESLGGALLGGFFATIFLALTLTDIEQRVLPNRIVYPSVLLAAALAWGWPATSVWQVFAGGGVGIAIGAALFLFSLPFGGEAFGMGDVKMIVLMGFVLGFPVVIPAVILGTIAAGLVAGILVLARLRTLQDYMPHGPFLALGAIVLLFASAQG